jgi:chemotaxis signal transduction protein
LLDRRTTALATRPPRAGSVSGQVRRSLIVWSLDESLYGIEVAGVAAVIPFAGCARVPTREAACLGIIGRAGRFYSVIALRRLLGAAAAAAPPLHLLLLRGGAPYLALAVDRVLGRFDLPADGPASELDGRLVALFDPAERLAALRNAPRAAP